VLLVAALCVWDCATPSPVDFLVKEINFGQIVMILNIHNPEDSGCIFLDDRSWTSCDMHFGWSTF
jgi:hypothetical protein